MRSRREERYSDEILALMLPRSIATQLKAEGDPDARFAACFPETSVLFGAGSAGGACLAFCLFLYDFPSGIV